MRADRRAFGGNKMSEEKYTFREKPEGPYIYGSGVTFIKKAPRHFRYADMFAGIGGFRQIMDRMGGTCIKSCEIDPEAAAVYEDNYGDNPLGDIKELHGSDIKGADVLCGGFPCQGFSVGGKKLGFADERGTLFFQLARLLRECISDGYPVRYIVFENVKNLLSHDCGNTWATVRETLTDMGYALCDPIIVNPVQFGIPQNRPRLLILGEYMPAHRPHAAAGLPRSQCGNVFGTGFFEEGPDEYFEKYALSRYQSDTLRMWDEFKRGIGELPIAVNQKYFRYTDAETAAVENPDERKVARRSAECFRANSGFITEWEKRWDNLEWVNPSHRRFEWQAGRNYGSVYECFAQFRQSGLRIKKPDFFPCLVAIVQTSIVPKFGRKLTPRECARLQTFPDSFRLAEKDRFAYKQLGNSICIEAVGYYASRFVTFD